MKSEVHQLSNCKLEVKMTSAQVQFKGQIKDITLPLGADTTWQQLQSALSEEFSVPNDAQRVFFNKKRIEFETAGEVTLRQLGWEETAMTAPRIMLMEGASRAQIEGMKMTQEAVEAEQRIRANRRVVSVQKRNQQHEAREALSTNYRFHSIKVLENFADAERARSILEQLANDRGVLAVMAKHKWSVGCLAEMYPDGKVGVDPVCVLGLNTNKGQKIELRLRTDDLLGFRKFLSIKKVLYHELSHNVHSDHDSKFYQLMRQVERECDELDWSNSGGRTVGGASGVAIIPDHDDATPATGQKLGGSTNPVSRLLMENPRPRTAEAVVPEPEPPISLLDTSSSTIQSADEAAQEPEPMDISTDDPSVSQPIEAPSRVVESTGPVIDLSQVSLLHSSLDGYQPSEREQRLRIALDSLRLTYTPEIVASTASFMHKVITNIVQHPSEPKYKSIRKSNRLFETRLACYPQCLDFLLAMGFEDQGESYVLARQDPALLWIGRSLLEMLFTPPQ